MTIDFNTTLTLLEHQLTQEERMLAVTGRLDLEEHLVRRKQSQQMLVSLAEYLKQVQSAEKLKDGSLDGYFQTTGYPQGTLSELAATNGFELLPIAGAERDRIMAQYKFFAKDAISLDPVPPWEQHEEGPAR